jgi:hypothetical protein
MTVAVTPLMSAGRPNPAWDLTPYRRLSRKPLTDLTRQISPLA